MAKAQGVAEFVFPMARFEAAELHWYEASGLGSFEFKIKHYLD